MPPRLHLNRTFKNSWAFLSSSSLNHKMFYNEGRVYEWNTRVYDFYIISSPLSPTVGAEGGTLVTEDSTTAAAVVTTGAGECETT